VTVNLGVIETSAWFILGEFVSGLDPMAVGARIRWGGRRSTGRSACAT
jgi:hypothetical protein